MEDLLSYKPAMDFSAMPDDDGDGGAGAASPGGRAASGAASGKRKRPAHDVGRADGDEEGEEGEVELDPAERARILKMFEAEGEVEEFNDAKVRKLALALERKVHKNQEMRVKYAAEPHRFMDSEVALHEQLQEFHVVATAPQYYPELIRLNTTETLVGLLGHENTDVCVEVLNLLQEMTDADAVEDSDGPATLFLTAMLKLDFFKCLLSAMRRMDEAGSREDANALHSALGIIENMLELNGEFGVTLLEETAFVKWALQRISVAEADSNKLYVSELLAILVQESDANRRRVLEGDGLDSVLYCLARFRKSDPVEGEEIEFMENLFDVLCSCMLLPELRPRFVEAEGIDLMLRMLREKNRSRRGALKVLSTVMVGPHGVGPCQTFVDRLGLKSIFPAFMKTPVNKLRKLGYSDSEFEELVCTIIAALLRNLTDDPDAHARVLGKFVEGDMAKVQRLAELFLAYGAKVQACEAEISAEREVLAEGGEEVDEVLENGFYLRRMDAGLVVLQTVAYIFAEACAGCGDEVRVRMHRILKLKGHSTDALATVLAEYADNVADDGLKPPMPDHVRALHAALAPKS